MDVEEFQSYIGFTEADAPLLRALWPHVEPHRDALVDDFYQRAMAHPSTRAVLASPEQVERLMGTLKIWLEELLNGPWDHDYVARRRHIGDVHVRVGLGHQAMHMAMSGVRQRLYDLAIGATAEPGPTVRALTRVTELDLALMTARYQSLMVDRSVAGAKALIVEHMPAVVLLVDRAGVVQSCTPATRALLGASIEPGDRIADALPSSLLEASRLAVFFERAFETGNAVAIPRVDIEIGLEQRYLSVTIVPFDEPEPAALVYLEDHTSTVENERLLRRQESLATIGTMSATIAHELRNPLAGISGALQVISRGLPADDPRAPIMTKVIEQVRSLNRLVSDLLTFARPTESKAARAANLREICESVIDNAAADYPDVEFRLEGTAGLRVDGDLVHQIVLNLVINACQALGGKGIVAVDIDDRRLRVCDSGPGLSPSQRAKAFEPFYTTKLKGTGLGLSISAKLARLLDADLRIEDDCPLGGASFVLAFGSNPAASAAASE